MKKILELAKAGECLPAEALADILYRSNSDTHRELFQAASEVKTAHFGNGIYVRGLIEFTNYCKNNCFYCGIRASNKTVERYRLSKEQILDCCFLGYQNGLRSFVLQGGEDPYYSADSIADLVFSVKSRYPDCAVTLSVGEHSFETYRLWKNAGADRYLLRHETADPIHYGRLHPSVLTLKKRMGCLYDLKSLDYQVGCGFMVGSPYQEPQHLSKELLFLKEFQPHMVGIGPFIPHKDTPFREKTGGSLNTTLVMLALIRLLLPDVLLPATTALGTIHPHGRELGIGAGANVCMPNLSPENVRAKYSLYNNKLHSGAESAAEISELARRMNAIGCSIVLGRGDHPSMNLRKE